MILIVGAGGHGQVVADILRAARAEGQPVPDAAFVDDDPRRQGHACAGVIVLGRVTDLAALSHDRIIVAVGENATRARLFAALEAAGERFAVACHPRSTVGGAAKIGDGTVIAAGAILGTATVVGRNVIVNTAATIDHHGVIEDHVHIAPGVHIGGEVRIGEGALVGIGATILPRLTVGAWSIVAAGAVVTKNVPPRSMVMGIPARTIRVSVEETETDEHADLSLAT